MNLTLTVAGGDQIQSTMMRCASLTAEDVANEARGMVDALTKENFLKYAQNHPNKLGGKTTRYWYQASNATDTTVSGSDITIVVDAIKVRGIKRHYTGGGTIRPSGKISEITGKPIRYLTIPINAAAHGNTVAMMQRLGVNLYRRGSVLVAQSGPEKSDSDVAMYALKKSIGPQTPNPAILPTQNAYYDAINTAVDELLDLD